MSAHHLVFDIETRVDAQLVLDAVYPGEDVSPEGAVARFREHLLRAGRGDFIPPLFHVPVTIAFAAVGGDHELLEVGTVSSGATFAPAELTGLFWLCWRQRSKPQLVTWGGKRFDLQVLMAQALRTGEVYPGRDAGHVDLREELARGEMSLSQAARCAALPGELVRGGPRDLRCVRGADVALAVEEGRLADVEGHCLTDVLTTYFLLLRWLVITGHLESDLELRQAARSHIEPLAQRYPAVEEWFEIFCTLQIHALAEWAERQGQAAEGHQP